MKIQNTHLQTQEKVDSFQQVTSLWLHGDCVTSIMLFRLENRAFSVQILEQKGTEKQAMKQVRALYKSLPLTFKGFMLLWLFITCCF